jgi:hypothetical protein
MDKDRRNFLKISLLGGGALLLAKIFGSDFMNLFSREKETKLTDFQGFKVSEDNKELVIYDKNGEAIFIIDNGK